MAPMVPTPDAHWAGVGIMAIVVVVIFLVLALPVLLTARPNRPMPSGDSGGAPLSDVSSAAPDKATPPAKSAIDRTVLRMAAAGLWAGVTFGTGLAVGGMVRPRLPYLCPIVTLKFGR